MRLLYASRSSSTHDHRFLSAWREEGVVVDSIFVDGSGGEAVPGEQGPEGFDSRLRTRIDAFRPDVIHAGPLTDVGSAVARVWSGPFVAMSWGFDLMDDIHKSRSAWKQAQAVIARADVLIVDNDGPRRVALELGAESSQIVQFPWGIDLEAFHPGLSDFRQSLSISQGDIVVLCTRRHEAIYDVQTVVDAFIATAPCSPRLRLMLAGSGTQTGELKATVHESGLRTRVNFLGEVDQKVLPSIYRAADLYVSPSRVDGSSVSLLEAMASGIPVCVSDIEGNRQWIADDRGLSFPVGDVGRLAQLLTALAAGTPADIQRAATQRRGRALDYVTKHANWECTRKALPGIARSAIEKNTEHK